MTLHKEEERLCRELGNKDGLQRSLGNQALILKAWGKMKESLALQKEKERLCRELGNENSLAISLINQAALLTEKGKHQAALSLAEEAYRLTKAHGYTALTKQIKTILNNIRDNS
jgi:hypothetical protein